MNRYIVKLLFGILSIALLGGCSSMRGANPTPIHGDAHVGELKDLYAEALKNAKGDSTANNDDGTANNDDSTANNNDDTAPEVITNYVKVGINLIETSCIRWFAKLSEEQRENERLQKDRNVISALGTSLISIGKLHSDVSSVYAAVNVAQSGILDNTDKMYGIVTDSKNVKQMVMSAIKQRADLMQKNEKDNSFYPRDFSSAYAQLEQLADICTYAEAQRLVNQTIEQNVKNTTVDEKTGQASIVSNIVSTAFSESESSEIIDGYLFDGTPEENAKNLKNIEGWLKDNMDSLPIANFLADKSLEKKRIKMIQDLSIAIE